MDRDGLSLDALDKKIILELQKDGRASYKDIAQKLGVNEDPVCDSSAEDGGEGEFDFFLTVLFPSDQLRILAYNRCVRALNGMSVNTFTKRIKELFNVRRGSPVSDGKGTFGMYLDGVWFSLHPKSEILQRYRSSVRAKDPVASLDLCFFQATLLEPVLDIRDQKKDRRKEFIGGEDSDTKIERFVDEKGGVGFTFHPVSVDELLAVADAGKIMSPKSTWFSPTLRSGLMVHRF